MSILSADKEDRSEELFWRLVGHVGAIRVRKEAGGNPQCDTECPECGKGRGHFGFSLKGGNCFACGYKTSLWRLSEKLGLDASEPYRPVERQVRPELPTRWQKNPESYVNQFASHPEVFALWQSHKPLSMDTIARYKLGVGALPSSQCKHRRLIVPILFNGEVLGFRGRGLGCECPKWLSSKNTKATLYGVEDVQPGDKVFWVENHVDALLVHELMPEFRGVASTAGAGTWRHLTALLVARKPSLVIVALDNDLVGCPNKETHKILADEFRRKNGREPMAPNGYGIMAALVKSRIRCNMWIWPNGTPAKMDMGNYLMEGL